eukprot:CAMPEP_0114519468 /NCGR_PEP_ID=MMETSP0109-20121206/19025_1 /TAXON_ID=29199 /ORGANISM="Chlorarachnion reptans, Strain CCCM449" /LENGTH=367 /DNA_ID=CAMNT_0001700221 /DNA_START=62 /DNA_END=1165 /DNA_ORIENTATION=+
MGIQEKIKEIEAEMARTQKNKATNYHLGRLKGKIAMLKSQLIGESKTGGKAGEGFDVARSGDARVAMIGFPSVGKSTLLSTLTKTKSESAEYAFTTLTCIPGVVEHNDAKIQLLDLPGIIEGASKGKGRGKQVIAAARTSDLILMVVEAHKAELQMTLLTRELEDVGIRINTRKPDITFTQKKTGGIKFNSTVDLTHCDERLCRDILQLHKIHNADILFRGDYTVDQFIDVIEGNRKYMRCLYVVNKVDTITIGEMDRLARLPDTVVVSLHWKANLDHLLEKMWEYLDVVRLYTKPRGKRPDFSDPIVVPRGTTILDVCNRIHRDFSKRFKTANVWGTSAKHVPQSVGIKHTLQDEDVIQLMTKAGK